MQPVYEKTSLPNVTYLKTAKTTQFMKKRVCLPTWNSEENQFMKKESAYLPENMKNESALIGKIPTHLEQRRQTHKQL